MSNDLPVTRDVERELLLLLNFQDSPLTAAQASELLAERFNLSAAQRNVRMPNSDECHWDNRVRTARNELCRKGMMDREPFNSWKLNSLGKTEAAEVDKLQDMSQIDILDA